MPRDNHSELLYQIALTMAPAIGAITARKLIEKVGSAREVILQKKETLQKIQGIGPRLSESIHASMLLSRAEQEIHFLEKHRIHAIYYKDDEYPERLRWCDDAPILLYAKGSKGLQSSRSLSVVGTRRATSYGRDVCREIIQGLSSRIKDLVIVSGLAYGIDVMAHKAALEFGLPTLAVLGHGLSTLYPHSHRDTARKIIHQGALVTDFHSRMGPERNNFLRRNRIIAGLSDATLVVESGESGGALITAELAASYHRDVLAVPGRAGDQRSVGCNALIKNNVAGLVESPDDVICHLNWEEQNNRSGAPLVPEIKPNKHEKLILQLMEEYPGISPELLCAKTTIPIQTMLGLLLEMELNSWLTVEPGNRYYSKITYS